MNLIIVRHGETDWNSIGRCQGISDVQLNDNGRRQTRELGESLKGEDISAVYSSNLKRAFDTAKEIARHHNLKVNIETDLSEMDQGVFEGLSFDEIRKDYSHILAKWKEDPDSLKLPDGESLKEVQERGWGVFEKVYENHREETVVLASHNLTINTLLCRFSKVGLKEARNFNLSSACKSLIVCEDGKFDITVLNDLSHLSIKPENKL